MVRALRAGVVLLVGKGSVDHTLDVAQLIIDNSIIDEADLEDRLNRWLATIEDESEKLIARVETVDPLDYYIARLARVGLTPVDEERIENDDTLNESQKQVERVRLVSADPVRDDIFDKPWREERVP